MKRLLFLPLLAFGLMLGACDSTVPTTLDELSVEELTVLSEVVAQSLADQTDGFMSDLYDAGAGVDRGGLQYGQGPLAFGFTGVLQRLWRGQNRYTTVSYDSTTGVHRLAYERGVSRPGMQNQMTADLRYRFLNAQGVALQWPQRSVPAIHTIFFEGTRTGSSTMERGPGSHVSTFNRRTQWAISGANTAEATLRGVQEDSGRMRRVTPEGTMERNFQLTLTSRDVKHVRSRQESGIEHALSGTLVYTMTVARTVNGVTETNQLQGEIELEGNGRALLRFIGFSPQFRINLDNGLVARAR